MRGPARDRRCRSASSRVMHSLVPGGTVISGRTRHGHFWPLRSPSTGRSWRPSPRTGRRSPARGPRCISLGLSGQARVGALTWDEERRFSRAELAGKIISMTGPRGAAVLALHWQVNVIKPEGFFGGMLGAPVARSGVVGRAVEFHAAARAAGGELVFTRFTVPGDDGCWSATPPSCGQ